MTYLDVWRSGTFLLYSCKSAFWLQETSPSLSNVERSVVVQSVFAISSALTYLQFFQECATPPHVQVCHCTWLGFTRPSPALVLQATNTGVRKPGYKLVLVNIRHQSHANTSLFIGHLVQIVEWRISDCVRVPFWPLGSMLTYDVRYIAAHSIQIDKRTNIVQCVRDWTNGRSPEGQTLYHVLEPKWMTDYQKGKHCTMC